MRSILIGLTIVTLCSCEFSVNLNNSESKTIDLGKMPTVKAKTFKNIQVIDETFCKTYDYPVTRFAIEYPDSIEVKLHEDEYSYINFKVKKGNEILEELSIGNTTLTKSTKSKSTELLEEIIPQFESQIESFNTDFIGISKFKGKMEYQFQGYADYSPYKEMGYEGKYRIMMMIPFPEKNDKIKAIMVSFVANENSGIKSYSDFQEKGVLTKVWNTFRYVE